MPSPPLPPESLRFMAEDDDRFLAIGDESVAELRQHVGLEAHDRILDLGCGYGRLAHALLRDPDFSGEYLGLDVLERQVEWCRRELAPLAGGRMAFRRVDVANARYNPHGGTPADRADLGVREMDFDVVALISVFTHLDPPTVERYLAEAAGALADGGRVFINAFMLDASWRECDEAGLSPKRFPHALTPFCRYEDEADPLAAIAYEPEWLLDRARDACLEPIRPPHLGDWCGRPHATGHLDVLALRRGSA